MTKRLKTLLHDWVRVKMHSVGENISGGIILTEPHMVRTGVVEDCGPGKRYSDGKFLPTQVKKGDVVVFFAGNMDTKQGKELRTFISEDEALLPESAILFLLDLEEGEEIPRITR